MYLQAAIINELLASNMSYKDWLKFMLQPTNEADVAVAKGLRYMLGVGNLFNFQNGTDSDFRNGMRFGIFTAPPYRNFWNAYRFVPFRK